MTDFPNNGMFEGLAAKALDLDGATVEQTGAQNPDASDHPARDTDGSLLGPADADGDERGSYA